LKTGDLLLIITRGLRSRKRRSCFLIAGVGMGVCLLFVLGAFCLGVKRVVLEKVIRTFPATQVEVKPFRGIDEKRSVRITREMLDEIKRMHGVKAIYPLTSITFPSMISSRTIGLESECAVYGIDLEFVKDDISPRMRGLFRYGTKPVPVVISRDLIELYNTSLAQSRGMPFLPQEVLIGQRFNLFLGVSVVTFGKVDRVRCEPCMIVGMSNRVPLMGVSVPAEYVREWQKWYYEPLEVRENIFSVFVQTDSVISAEAVAKELSARGLRVTSGKETAERVASIARIILAFLAVVSVALLFVVGVGIMNGLAMSVMEQAQRIGLLRAFGARRVDVLRIFIGEAAVIGVIGGAIGVSAGYLLLRVADEVVRRYLPPFPFKPESFFHSPVWLVCVVLLFSIFVSVISGLPPALQAANLKPADALRMK